MAIDPQLRPFWPESILLALKRLKVAELEHGSAVQHSSCHTLWFANLILRLMECKTKVSYRQHAKGRMNLNIH